MSTNIQTASIDDLLDQYPKQTLIANAWLVAPGVRYQDLADLLQTSDEHARRTFRELEAGDIEIDSVADPAVQTRLGELLTEADMLTEAAGPVGVRTAREEVPEWWQDGKRAPPTPERDGTVEGEAHEKELPGTAKERLLAAWHIITESGDEVINRELAAVADCSEEHARRTRNAIETGEIDQTAFDAISDEVWDVISERLVSEGVMTDPRESDTEVAAEDVDESVETDEAGTASEFVEGDEREEPNESLPTEERDESGSPPETPATSASLATTENIETETMGEPVSRQPSARDEMIPAREVQRVHDILDVLRREAEATDNVKAEFIANEAVAQLKELLDAERS